jgi:hypothetical protein
MKSHSRRAVDGWIASEAALRDPNNPVAVFDAQSWAAQARSYTDALQFVAQAMEAIGQFLEERTARRAGGNPDELAERAAARFDDTAALLEQLGQGSRS